MVVQVVAGALGVGLLLAGCSGDPGSTVLPPLPSTVPAVSVDPSVVPLPPEAVPETAQGASAFAKYYFAEVVNAAYLSLDADLVVELSAPDCNACQNIIGDIGRLRAAGRTVPGVRFKVQFAEAPAADADGSFVVDLRFSSDPYLETESSGEVVRRQAAQVNQDAQVRITRGAKGWSVRGIRTVES